ncbi:MAG: DUF4440 domain-containing protein [Egibacteraceae bacterium]
MDRLHHIVEAMRDAFERGDRTRFGELLADDVRWYGAAPGGCYSRDDALAFLAEQDAQGVRFELEEVRVYGDRVLMHVEPSVAAGWQVLNVDADGRIASIVGYSSAEAAERDVDLRSAGEPAQGEAGPVRAVTPFVRVTNVARSIAFYRLLGLRVSETYEPDGVPVWACLDSAEGPQIMFEETSDALDAGRQGVLFYLYSSDLPALRDQLVTNGVEASEIVDGSPGPPQEMRVTDPDGYCLMIAQI